MFLAIVDAVVSLSYAYAAIVDANNGGEFLARLQVIQTYLITISRKLDEIQKTLADIEKAIAKLPVLVRDQIDDALAKDALAISNSICQRLNDYMRPAYIEQSLPAMRTDLNSLQDQIWRVKGAKGLAGVFLTSPLVAIWLSGRATFEKASLVYDANHVLDSPWGQTFMMDSRKEFEEAYLRLQEAQDFHDNWIVPHTPYIEEEQKVIQAGTEYYFERLRGGGPGRKYRLHDFTNPVLQVKFLLQDWTDVDRKVRSPDWQAVEALNLNEQQAEEYKAFALVYDGLQNRKSDIFASFDEPVGFWN
jgi:hypothetical protein